MRGLEREVRSVGRGGESEVGAAVFEGLEEESGPGEGLRGGEVLALEGGLFGLEVGAGNGELGPGVEDFCCLCGEGALAGIPLGRRM